jgi:hypothetical protein
VCASVGWRLLQRRSAYAETAGRPLTRVSLALPSAATVSHIFISLSLFLYWVNAIVNMCVHAL